MKVYGVGQLSLQTEGVKGDGWLHAGKHTS